MAEKVCSRMNLSCFGNDYEHLLYLFIALYSYAFRKIVSSAFKGH